MAFVIDKKGNLNNNKSSRELELEGALLGNLDTNGEQTAFEKANGFLSGISEFSEYSSESERPKDVWSDSEDEAPKDQIEAHTPKWARILSEKSKRKFKNRIKTDSKLIKENPKELKKDILSVVNIQTFYNDGSKKSEVSCIDFHPETLSFLIAHRQAKQILIYNFNGDAFERSHCIIIKQMPIVSAKFIEKGEKILISGKTSYFMVYNFSNGSVDTIKTFRGNVKNGGKLLVSPTYTNFALTEDFGSVRIFDAVSQKETNRIRINGTVRQACFSADGKRVFAVGDDSEIYEFDIKSKICVDRIKDVGSVKLTAIAVSLCGQFIAVGNDTGNVNLYKKKKLIKSFGNLLTGIDGLDFNFSSELLLIYSSGKASAIRIISLKHLTVYPNWPSLKNRFGRVTTAMFSKKSTNLLIGTKSGKAVLCKLPFYDILERNRKFKNL